MAEEPGASSVPLPFGGGGNLNLNLEDLFSRLSTKLVEVAPVTVVDLCKHLMEKLTLELERVDALLEKEKPSSVVLKTFALAVGALWLARFTSTVIDVMREQGYLQSTFNCLKRLPGISHLVRKEKEKIAKKMEKQVLEERYSHSKVPKFSCLPSKPLTHEKVFDTIAELNAKDVGYQNGKSKLSGAVYFNSMDHADFQTKVYGKFVGTNPIHADSYPSVARMDAELVAMTASLFRPPEEHASLNGSAAAADGKKGKKISSSVCGSVTSGGSESILCAMKASRDWWLSRNGYGIFRNLLNALPWRKGTVKPEIIMADSAHAAYVKAAEYYNLKMVMIRVDESTGFRLTASAVRRRITSNTAIIIASAPSYPHGVCDDLEGIGKVAKAYGIPCHVDACLGGFVLPFAKEAGFSRPRVDFGIDGVTSMSVDTHKYGLAHKGTSIVLYRNKDIRKHQFTKITDWSGGLYISPTMAGSRSGAVIAAAWASLLAVGKEGFVTQCRKLLGLAERLAQGIKGIKEIKLLGKPDSSVVAWAAEDPKSLDIFKVNDAMSKRGWHLSALQRPAGLHMCITPAHSKEMIDKLVVDLQEACKEVLKAPKDGEEGMAPIYGLAESLPDRNIIGDVLVAYQEAALDC